MKFSLITGTYGRTEVIRGLLNSLKRQSHHNFELIVVDQNPNSIVEWICHNYDLYFKIKYVKSKVTGLSRARNIGIKYATGDIIAFPDDDCQYYEETLQNVHDLCRWPYTMWFLLRIFQAHGLLAVSACYMASTARSATDVNAQD